MGVEGGDLPDLGLGQTHLLGQRAQMRGRQMALGILDQVQMLDQQVAAARAVAQQRPHLGQRGIVELAALGRRAPAALARFPDTAGWGLGHALLRRRLPRSSAAAARWPRKTTAARPAGRDATAAPHFRRNDAMKFRQGGPP
jgi:hypothetical protein